MVFDLHIGRRKCPNEGRLQLFTHANHATDSNLHTDAFNRWQRHIFPKPQVASNKLKLISGALIFHTLVPLQFHQNPIKICLLLHSSKLVSHFFKGWHQHFLPRLWGTLLQKSCHRVAHGVDLRTLYSDFLQSLSSQWSVLVLVPV